MTLGLLAEAAPACEPKHATALRAQTDPAIARLRAEWRSPLLRRLRRSMDGRQKTFAELARQPDLASLVAYARQRSHSSYGTYVTGLATLAHRFKAEGDLDAAEELATLCLVLRPTGARACAMIEPLLPALWPASLEHLRADCLRFYSSASMAESGFAARVVSRFSDVAASLVR